MNKIIVLCMTLFLIVLSVNSSFAHSTKGRIKVPLDKEILTVDDVAYFCESYVHRELYRDKYEKWEKRFYVNKFINIDQDKNRAVINFKTLDVKDKSTFVDKMAIHRLDNGIWVLDPQNGRETRKIFTYMKKTTYYYNKYGLPISAAGFAIALSGFGFIQIKKRKRTAWKKHK